MVYLKYQINQHLEIIVAISFEIFYLDTWKLLYSFLFTKKRKKKD